MNKDRYYRVKEVKTNNGNAIYKVLATNSLFWAILGVWDHYTKDNDTLDEAIKQIEYLNGERIKSSVTVFKKKAD